MFLERNRETKQISFIQQNDNLSLTPSSIKVQIFDEGFELTVFPYQCRYDHKPLDHSRTVSVRIQEF